MNNNSLFHSLAIRINTELTRVIAIITTSMCTTCNYNIQTLPTVQHYELIVSNSNKIWYLVVKKSWLLLVFFQWFGRLHSA